MQLEELHKLGIFHKKDVVSICNSDNSAKELLRRYKKAGLISQIRRDLYAVNDLAYKMVIPAKFEIGSNITDTSYLAYHAALEYHGLATQVFNRLYIASEQRFKNFEYEGITYCCCETKFYDGVVNPQFNSMLKVTDLERTIIDCIDNIGLSGGLEELIMGLALVTLVKEPALLKYLEKYNKRILYQKAGFILSYFKKEFHLSDDFFKICKSKIGKSVGFLTDKSNSTTFFKEWSLYAPDNILAWLEQGETGDV
jgi:predicted transcriptional regulator of viral defense system